MEPLNVSPKQIKQYNNETAEDQQLLYPFPQGIVIPCYIYSSFFQDVIYLLEFLFFYC